MQAIVLAGQGRGAYQAGMRGLRISASGGLQWRDVLLALALFAAVVRALVPPGFMLAAHEGRVDIVICTVDGAKTVSGQTRESDGRGPALAGMSAPCAFAGLAAAAPPPEAVIVSVAQAIAVDRLPLSETPSLAPQAAYRSQAPRAPPVLHT